MSRSRHSEAEIIAALKQVDAGRKVEDVARGRDPDCFRGSIIADLHWQQLRDPVASRLPFPI